MYSDRRSEVDDSLLGASMIRLYLYSCILFVQRKERKT